MKRFEDIIQEKLNTFEYPYEEKAWKNFSKKYTLHKWIRRSIFSSAVIIVILTFTYLVSHQTQNKETDTTKTEKPVQQIVINEKHSINHQTIFENTSPTIIKEKQIVPQTNQPLPTNDIVVSENYSQTFHYNDNIIKNTTQEENCPYTINISDQKGCVPLTVSFSISNLPEFATCIWNFGDGGVSSDKNPTYTYHKVGKYKVSVKILLNKQTNKQIIIAENPIIQVLPKPIAWINVKQEANNLIFENQSKQYSSFYWHFGDSIINEETWKYSAHKSGKYHIKLIAENQYGCKDTIMKSIDFTYLMPVQLADAFTPDGDGINDLFGPQVLDYDSYQFAMQIYNKTGRLVFETKGSPIWWDGTDMNNRQMCSPDVYFYKIIAVDKLGNKQEFSGKIQLIR